MNGTLLVIKEPTLIRSTQPRECSWGLPKHRKNWSGILWLYSASIIDNEMLKVIGRNLLDRLLAPGIESTLRWLQRIMRLSQAVKDDEPVQSRLSPCLSHVLSSCTCEMRDDNDSDYRTYLVRKTFCAILIGSFSRSNLPRLDDVSGWASQIALRRLTILATLREVLKCGPHKLQDALMALCWPCIPFVEPEMLSVNQLKMKYGTWYCGGKVRPRNFGWAGCWAQRICAYSETPNRKYGETKKVCGTHSRTGQTRKNSTSASYCPYRSYLSCNWSFNLPDSILSFLHLNLQFRTKFQASKPRSISIDFAPFVFSQRHWGKRIWACHHLATRSLWAFEQLYLCREQGPLM